MWTAMFITYSVAMNKVATYKELDNDLQRTAQFSMLVSNRYNQYSYSLYSL